MMQSWLTAESITAIATAVTAFAVIVIPFIIESRNRLYEARRTHHQKIKDEVLTFLRNLLVDFYSRILSRKESTLKRISAAVHDGNPTIDAETKWKYVYDLNPREPHLSLARALSGEEYAEELSKTFHQLYKDAKVNHLQAFFAKWETFTNQVDALSNSSRAKVIKLAQTLEGKIKMPPLSNPSAHGPWVDYLSLALVIYDHVWCLYPNSLALFQDSNTWVLRYISDTIGRGEKDQLANCQRVAQELFLSEKETFEPLVSQTQSLQKEAESLRRELEQLLLINHLRGRCPYIRTQLF